jgi:HAD superfamily hydrolase (TIGR01509 family)
MSLVIKALLFDFDGTILDTETVEHRAWAETYRAHGVELTLDRWAVGIGTLDGFDPLGHLEELLGAAIARDEVDAKRVAHSLAMLADEPLRPGVEAYLEQAHALGLKVGIVSSSSRRWIDENLARAACIRDWACVVTAEGDAARAKPAPTLYLEALELLGAEPGEAIAFEDSPNGVAAAQAAGIFTVAVPNSVTRQLDLGSPDLRLESLEELTVAQLLELVAERRAA